MTFARRGREQGVDVIVVPGAGGALSNGKIRCADQTVGVQARFSFPIDLVFSKIAFKNNDGDISGRPQGPYTVKKRKPVAGKRNRWLYAWAINSFAFLVAAYRLTG